MFIDMIARSLEDVKNINRCKITNKIELQLEINEHNLDQSLAMIKECAEVSKIQMSVALSFAAGYSIPENKLSEVRNTLEELKAKRWEESKHARVGGGFRSNLRGNRPDFGDKERRPRSFADRGRENGFSNDRRPKRFDDNNRHNRDDFGKKFQKKF